MKRILLSLSMIVAVGTIGLGATGAFFSDTETSTGNTFTAGAIDLKIDNHSYYNGNECVIVGTGPAQQIVWQGDAPFPVPGTPCALTWEADDLNNGLVTLHKFFDFTDLKPGDYSEDTISLHVNNNDAYMCAYVELTSNKDNDCNTPESADDPACGTGDANTNGDLAQNVNFLWWADDGDNVLETDENLLPAGALGALGVGNTATITLADTSANIWNPANAPGPLPGGQDRFIGKAWCFGTITAAAVAPDTGDPRTNPGYTCNGTALNNAAQTDSTTADVSFFAVQSRNNPNFLCSPRPNAPCPFSENTPGPNLVTNGGFEDPEVISGAQWDIFPSPAAGWNILWRDGAPVSPSPRPALANLELHEGVLGVAFEGNQYAELDSDWNGHGAGPDGEPSATIIYQDITTVPGASYSLSYRFAPRPGTGPTDNDLESRLGGVVMNDTGPVGGAGGNLVLGDWVLKGPYNFIATTTTTRLQFTDLGSTNNSLGTFIDDAKLVQISCPNVQ